MTRRVYRNRFTADSRQSRCLGRSIGLAELHNLSWAWVSQERLHESVLCVEAFPVKQLTIARVARFLTRTAKTVRKSAKPSSLRSPCCGALWHRPLARAIHLLTLTTKDCATLIAMYSRRPLTFPDPVREVSSASLEITEFKSSCLSLLPPDCAGSGCPPDYGW